MEQQQSLSSYAADALSLRGESSLGAVARALGALREAVTMCTQGCNPMYSRR